MRLYSRQTRLLLSVLLVLVFGSLRSIAQPAARPTSFTSESNQLLEWERLWTPHPVPNRRVRREYVTGISDLGEDIAGKEWRVVATQYHDVYYMPSMDPDKLEQLLSRLDNIYAFLAPWSPAPLTTPVRVFLIPGQWAHSRCSVKDHAMRTGDVAPAEFLLTSLLHEETHLFNFAYLGGLGQGCWAGEFSCQYFQLRAGMEREGRRVLQEIVTKRLPWGPSCKFGQIALDCTNHFPEAFSALYFLDEAYGADQLVRLREAWLKAAKERHGGTDGEDAFLSVCGKGFDKLDREWRQFYRWPASLNLEAYAEPETFTQRIVQELCGAAYAGRAAGDAGEEKAAVFLRQCLVEMSLAPIRDGEGYLQRFGVASRDLVGPIGLKIDGQDYTYPTDFGILNGGPKEWLTGEMVFLGTGVEPTDLDRWPQAAGKIGVAFRPQSGSSQSARRIELAQQHAALALLEIDLPGNDAEDAYARKNCKLNNKLPVLHVSTKIGTRLFAESGTSLARAYALTQQGKTPDIALQGLCTLAAGADYDPSGQSSNVVGMLSSSSPNPRKALVFAHYDGQGRDGRSEYYPSANDNTSGVAVLLSLAWRLKAREDALPTDIVFVALGAEEVGLAGARALMDHPYIVWDDYDVAICLDMVGHADKNELYLQTTDTSAAEYLSMQTLATEQGWDVRPLQRTRLGSDAGVIQDSGVPTLFLLTGDRHQHTVADGPENTDPNHMGRMVRLLQDYLLTHAWKSSPDPLAHDDTAARYLNQWVTVAAAKASIQTLVQQMAKQIDLRYDWSGSADQTDGRCRLFVYDFSVTNMPLQEALEKLLVPHHLTYVIRNHTITLRLAVAENSQESYGSGR